MNKYGFVKLSNYLEKSEAEQIVKWADELDVLEEVAGKWMIYFESNGKRNRIENFLAFKSDIKQFAKNKIQPLLENILGNKVCLFKEKLNWKYGQGKGFAAHQDQPAWTDFPVSKFYTVAICADNTTPENGCLEFTDIKYNEILPYNKSGNGEVLNSDNYNWKYITTTPNDILIFDSYSLHRSGDNKTDTSRRIFYFTYNLASDGDFYDNYIKQKRKALPPKIEREIGKTYNILGNKYNLANPIV